MQPARPRKRFGQNFLEDSGVISRIERAVAPREQDHLVEIGPGRGALTEALIGSGCRLDAIELDRDLTTGLLAAFSIHPRFRLHSADALQFDYASLLDASHADDERLRIVGNLPYNIATPLIFPCWPAPASSRTCISCCSGRWCSAWPPNPVAGTGGASVS